MKGLPRRSPPCPKRKELRTPSWAIPCQFRQFFEISEPSIFDFLYVNICCSTDQENDSDQVRAHLDKGILKY